MKQIARQARVAGEAYVRLTFITTSKHRKKNITEPLEVVMVVVIISLMIVSIGIILGFIYKGPDMSKEIETEQNTDEYKIVCRINSLKEKRQRLSKLIELTDDTNNDRNINELMAKQQTVLEYINSYYYKYCALLLRCYAVNYTEKVTKRYEQKTIDGLIMIKQMKNDVEGIYRKVVNEYSLEENTTIDGEMDLILEKIQGIINSVAIVETKRIVESLSPIDETNRILTIVNATKDDLEYNDMKSILDMEYDRFLAENEIK